jgi:Uma2 family endonuclease
MAVRQIPAPVSRRKVTVDEYDRMIELGILTENHPVELIRGTVVYKSGYGPRAQANGPRMQPYRFTVDEYHRMIDAGILHEDERVELIHGELVCSMPIGDRHAGCVNRLNFGLGTWFAGRTIVSVQNPVVLADSEPQPDIALLAPRQDFYSSGKPRPADVQLLIEVADSTFDDDRDVKGPLYAENAIPEYWIVNLNDDTVHVFRGPRSDGTWASDQQFTRGGTLTVAALPGVSVPVSDVLP